MKRRYDKVALGIYDKLFPRLHNKFVSRSFDSFQFFIYSTQGLIFLMYFLLERLLLDY